MRISKNGNGYKIKCSRSEYLVLKYSVFDIDGLKDESMRDFVMENHLTDEEIDEVAKVMKGMD